MAPDTSLFSGRPSELIGRRIAGYRIELEIGRGGMAVVYRARDLSLERTVALKLLAPELARNDTFRKRFVHESRTAAAIDHPHIVPVFEAGETDGVLYIAMRYVPGSDLKHLIDRQGPLPLPAAVRIGAQVASALDAAHDHGLVHRDVKPGNILVDRGTDADHPEHVYLTDFGLTKKSLSLTGFTQIGQFVGTLDYVSPEQISGRPVDGRCDVYGFACVVYETLTGHPPFQREDDMALLWAHQYDDPPPLSGTRSDLPAAADAVFARALAKSAEDRYDSCLDFVAALRDAGGGGGGGAHSGGRTPTEVDVKAVREAEAPATHVPRAAAPAQSMPGAGRPVTAGPGTGPPAHTAHGPVPEAGALGRRPPAQPAPGAGAAPLTVVPGAGEAPVTVAPGAGEAPLTVAPGAEEAPLTVVPGAGARVKAPPDWALSVTGRPG